MIVLERPRSFNDSSVSFQHGSTEGTGLPGVGAPDPKRPRDEGTGSLMLLQSARASAQPHHAVRVSDGGGSALRRLGRRWPLHGGASPRAGRPLAADGAARLARSGPVGADDGRRASVRRAPDRRDTESGRFWKYDASSGAAWNASVKDNRDRLREIIGVVDARLPSTIERFGDDDNPALVGETSRYRIYQVRWVVLEGVFAEGLLVQPATKHATPRARAVVMNGVIGRRLSPYQR